MYTKSIQDNFTSENSIYITKNNKTPARTVQKDIIVITSIGEKYPKNIYETLPIIVKNKTKNTVLG